MARPALILAVALAAPALGNVLDASAFSESLWASSTSLQQITGLGWAPDGSNRLFAIRKDGHIEVISNGVVQTPGYYVLSPTPHVNSECGLIGFTFDRDFINNHYIYLFVTVSASEQQIIRITDLGLTAADPFVVLDGLPTAGNNHDGGGLRFGPDGDLYWAIGDLGNGTGVNADLLSLAAKIGRARIDRVTGRAVVPNDNPFFDGTGPNNDFIWARGVRNPFTMEFEPATGRLFVNVVGTNWEQIFTPIAGSHAGYNAVENGQPPAVLSPIVAYATNSAPTWTIAGGAAVRTSGVTTFTVSSNAAVIRAGITVSVAGVGDSSFNGTHVVLASTANSIIVAQPALPNATSGGGTATLPAIGGCITGGAFYDSTAFPPAYWDNYFFGDLNTGNMTRVSLNPATNEVASVLPWGDGILSVVDMVQGPDGALYYAPHGFGTVSIRRAAAIAAAQAIVISNRHLSIDEASSGVVSVSLLQAPAGSTTVTVSSAGDSDVAPVQSSLSFTTGNWSLPQPVRINAADDADSADDSATVTFSSAGLTSRQAAVSVRDDDTQGIVLSKPSLAVAEGGYASFSVRLERPPSSPTIVTISKAAGDADISVFAGASLTFDAENYQAPQSVTVFAAQDADNVNDVASLSVAAAEAPARTVAVTALDDEVATPQFLSTPVTRGVVGTAYQYDVDALGNPAPTYALPAAPAGALIDSATGAIAWTPSAAGTYSFTVQAQNMAGTASQSFAVVVNDDQPPTASITRPQKDTLVSGEHAEFFGDGVDDVGTMKAEFYVDGVLHYTDENAYGHFHHGGAHNAWDTTRFSDGEHTLRMVVTDTKGQTGAHQIKVNIQNGAASCGCTSGSGDVALALAAVALTWRARKSSRRVSIRSA